MRDITAERKKTAKTGKHRITFELADLIRQHKAISTVEKTIIGHLEHAMKDHPFAG